MRQRLLFFAVGSICAVMVYAQVGADGEVDLANLRDEKVRAAQEWANALGASNPGPDYGEFYRAAQALKDARYEAAKSKDGRLRALIDYRESVTRLHDKIKLLNDLDAVGGESYWLEQAKFRILEARVWIAEERAK
jgi:hypothetical protein